MDGMDGEWSVRVVSHVMLMAYNQLTIPEMASPFARCCGFEVGALSLASFCTMTKYCNLRCISSRRRKGAPSKEAKCLPFLV